jgi:hypothetical protein
MFTSESELFSIGIINLLLENVSVVIVNIVQIERTMNFANFAKEPIKVSSKGHFFIA